MADEDRYSRVDYRRLIAWPARIERERPLLERLFSEVPDKSLIDIGCGTGEHARFFASLGFEVLGIDASESMIEKAHDAPNPDSVSFVLGDLRDLGATVEKRYGAAICLGNVLPHIKLDEELDAFAEGLRASLLTGAPLLLQILNYDRIVANQERYLPLSFRPDDEGEIIFLRLMKPQPDGSVLFFPSTLRLTDDEEEPLELVSSRRVPIRGWQSAEVRTAFERAGFHGIEILGSVDDAPFDSSTSSDIILTARA